MSEIKKMLLIEVQEKINSLNNGNELGVLVKDDDNKEPWERIKQEQKLANKDFPSEVKITRANMLYIDKSDI